MPTKHDCPYCESGQVTFRIGTEVHSTETCPDCKGTGELSRDDYILAKDGIDALNTAIADEQYKY